MFVSVGNLEFRLRPMSNRQSFLLSTIGGQLAAALNRPDEIVMVVVVNKMAVGKIVMVGLFRVEIVIFEAHAIQ